MCGNNSSRLWKCVLILRDVDDGGPAFAIDGRANFNSTAIVQFQIASITRLSGIGRGEDCPVQHNETIDIDPGDRCFAASQIGVFAKKRVGCCLVPGYRTPRNTQAKGASMVVVRSSHSGTGSDLERRKSGL